jgi:pimeloyl-ACP methyl ester carboxylesterase
VLIYAACSGEHAVPFTPTAGPTRTPAPQGARAIDVGGYSLEIRCEGSGSPTVVFENGALPLVDVFTDFKPAVVDAGWRACSYDRAGTGESDAGPNPRDATQIAAELDRLLTNAGERGPFVFATLSAGALYTMTYVHNYPERACAIVFIDPRLPAYQLALPSVFDDPEEAALIEKLPEGYRLEYEPWNDDAQRLVDAGPLPDLPVVVLTAGDPEHTKNLVAPWDDYELWVRTHADLAASVPRGEHVIVGDAAHIIFQKNPDAVLDAIRRVVQASGQ